jgi:hypothetical protein
LRSKVKVSQRSLRYATHRLMVMHPHTWMMLFKKQLFDLEVKCPTKVITVRSTLPYGHSPTYQISLTYLERQKWHGPDKKILFKKRLFDLEVKDQGPTKVIIVHDTPHYGHAPRCQISLIYLERQKNYGSDKLRWEEAEEAEEKITLKQYVSLRSKGRHKY